MATQTEDTATRGMEPQSVLDQNNRGEDGNTSKPQDDEEEEEFEEDLSTDDEDSSDKNISGSNRSSTAEQPKPRIGKPDRRLSGQWSVHSQASYFEMEFEYIREDPNEVAIVLENFVERCTREDVAELRDLLWTEYFDEQGRIWESVTLVDEPRAHTWRRFRYKKDNCHHHLYEICQQLSVELLFEVRLSLNIDHFSNFATTIQLLDEARQDRDVISLSLEGHCNFRQIGKLLHKLSTVLQWDFRPWRGVNLRIGFEEQEQQLSGHKTGNKLDDRQKAIVPVSEQREAWIDTLQEYMVTFSDLYERWGIAIDVKPLSE